MKAAAVFGNCFERFDFLFLCVCVLCDVNSVPFPSGLLDHSFIHQYSARAPDRFFDQELIYNNF